MAELSIKTQAGRSQVLKDEEIDSVIAALNNYEDALRVQLTDEDTDMYVQRELGRIRSVRQKISAAWLDKG